jgi:endonuclease V-like protein UPF0215 family
MRIPVMAGPRCIELADKARVRRLIQAPNVVVIRRKKDRRIVEIQLQEYGDDSRVPTRLGNPLAYSHKSETQDNVANVWALKRIPQQAATIFSAVLDECIS